MTHPQGDEPLFVRKLFPKAGGRENRVAVVTVPPGQADAYSRAALADEVATLASTPEGGRNDQLNRSGFNLAQFVAAGHLEYDAVWNALHTTALNIGLPENEVIATLRSAFRGGMERPRLVAVQPDPDTPEVTVMPTDQHDGAEEEYAPPSLRDRFPALDWHELWADENEDEWIVEPLIPVRRLVALFSPPKVGKSLLMLELAVAIARGAPVLGTRLERPRRVLYVDFENDPRGDLRPRLQAMGLGPDDLDGLFYLSMPRLAYLDSNIGGIELLAIAREYDVEVVVIDTISRAVAGEENDNDTWLAFYRNTGLLLKAEGIATIRLDHTGKDQTKGMRGGSAKYGDVDAVWSMTKLSETEFQLDCTANRLPIAEKRLTVRRETFPTLRHVVDTSGKQEAFEENVQLAIRYLNRAEFPAEKQVNGVAAHGSGPGPAWAAVRHVVAGTTVKKRHVEEAQRRRLDPHQFSAQLKVPDAPPD